VATDFAYVVTGNVQITKTSNAATPLYPGDTFTYTVTVTNPAAAGTNLLTGVSLYDVLPPGLTGVAGTTSLSRSSVADNFGSASFALNAGTRNWAGNWAENDAAGAGTGTGDVQIVGGELDGVGRCVCCRGDDARGPCGSRHGQRQRLRRAADLNIPAEIDSRGIHDGRVRQADGVDVDDERGRQRQRLVASHRDNETTLPELFLDVPGEVSRGHKARDVLGDERLDVEGVEPAH
jgi:uncharacterized repeat protein (TIGR01451 family)